MSLRSKDPSLSLTGSHPIGRTQVRLVEGGVRGCLITEISGSFLGDTPT